MNGQGSFTVCVDTRLDSLAEELSRVFSSSPLPPLEREVVIVQSQGMRHWLMRRLADLLGISTAIDMPFPGSFCRQLAAESISDAEQENASPFDREILTWRLFSLFDQLPAEPCFDQLRSYVAEERDAGLCKRRQFCGRLASLFDAYQMYRPDLLQAWEGGADWLEHAEDGGELPVHAAWQARLWRKLCEGVGSAPHLGNQVMREIELLKTAKDKPARLPSRIQVFGVNSLPPVFVQLLKAASRFVPVTFYVVSATDKPPGAGDNPLLESLAQQGADFFKLLRGNSANWRELGSLSPGEDCLLHALQSDIISRRNRGEVGGAAPLPLAGGDNSLLVHSCHSPMREMEVLRDQLLFSFESDPSLRPHDVLVLLTDVALYAPYVEAVFGRRLPLPGGAAGEGDDSERGLRWPYHIADRAPAQQYPLAGAFLQLLALAESRLSASEVIGLLEFPAIRDAARLAEDDLPTLREWVGQANIRWGLDAGSSGKPAVANTWRAGLDRWLTGFAAGEAGFINGVLADGGPARAQPDLLGRFAYWLDQLFSRLNSLDKKRTLAEWSKELSGLLHDLLRWDDSDRLAQESADLALDEIGKLAHFQEVSGCGKELELAVIREHLGLALEGDGFGHDFLTGRITFCALKPMRTIPFKVVAICGLGNDSFPRKDRPDAFDLQAVDPRVGDRSLRADDKQTFLDYLLAARSRLLLFHVGRSAKDNSEKAPSICLSELLDYLDQAFAAPGNRPVRQAITVEHRLQPFSPAYFSPANAGKLFSYAAENCICAAALPLGRNGQNVFYPSGRAAAGEEEAGAGGETIRLADLIEAWLNPSRLYCLRALGLRLGADEDQLCDEEPLAVEGLEKYKLQQELFLQMLRQPNAAKESLARLSAKGELPPDELAQAWHSMLGQPPRELAEQCRGVAFAAPAEIEIRLPQAVLAGRIDNLTNKGLLQARCASIKAKDMVRAWIMHLALNASRPQAAAGCFSSRLLGLGGEEIVFRELQQARALEIMAQLFAGYREALRQPQPFFPETCRQLYLASESKANSAWHGDSFRGRPGEGDDAYAALCFRGVSPLESPTLKERMISLSKVFWQPFHEEGAQA